MAAVARPDWVLSPEEWPTSVEAAARDLVAWLTPGACAQLRALPRAAVFDLHLGLGITIRDRYALWKNAALCTACGSDDPDAAWEAIAVRAWELLRAEHD